MKLIARDPEAWSRSSAFQRWFRIENRHILGEVMAIYVKSVRIFTKLAISLSKKVRFSSRELRTSPIISEKDRGELIRAGALNDGFPVNKVAVDL